MFLQFSCASKAFNFRLWPVAPNFEACKVNKETPDKMYLNSESAKFLVENCV